MLQATQLKNNTIFEYNNQLFRVVKYTHSHISRRAADIKVKVKNLLTGATLVFNFSSNQKFPPAVIDRKNFSFLYSQDQRYYFMQSTNFEQIEIPQAIIKEKAKYLKENMQVDILFWHDQPIDVELPNTMVFAVAKTSPGVKGNSATNIFKPAFLENGLSIRVPLFIKPGDKIKVDTRTGQYIERAG